MAKSPRVGLKFNIDEYGRLTVESRPRAPTFGLWNANVADQILQYDVEDPVYT